MAREKKKKDKNPHKIGSVSWHQWHINKIKETSSNNLKKWHDKKRANLDEAYHNTNVEPRKQPRVRYRSRVEYDFLKYIRVVYKWAATTYDDLSRGEIDLLLYLYAEGAFSRKQFNDFHKLMGLYSIKTLKKFQDHGYIKLWRPRTGRQHALYVLTHKAKLMCNKMHRYCAGIDDIPSIPTQAEMGQKVPRINNYFMDIIKKMNKDKAPNE